MKLEDIKGWRTTPYFKKCSCCGLQQTILTQDSNSNEYYTEIYLQCQCGEYIEFILPVN